MSCADYATCDVVSCSAAEDIEHVEHIRSLLEDIQNVRQDKIRNGLYKISSDVQTGGSAYAIQVCIPVWKPTALGKWGLTWCPCAPR